jgi:hypothetical protein
MDEIIAAAEAAAAANRGLVESIAEVQAAVDALHGKDINIGVNAAQAAAAAAAVGDLTGAERGNAAAAVSVAAATTAAAGATRDLAVAGDAAAAAGGRAWRPWFLFGATWQTALHWIIAGGAEILAVTVPALVALGAGALVAMQGASNVAQHMSALYTATEATAQAFHTTVGDVLGLGHALQTAQDAANPGVYEILGSVINDAKSRFADFAGTGLQVVHMLDEFSARITVDLQGALGGQLHGLLSAMVPDLQMLGQLFGNLGHAVLSFASAMPGLAEVLLGVANGISRVILWVSELPAGLITSVMALEEFYRWGGLVIGILVRLTGATAAMNALGATNFITRFGAGLAALIGVGGAAIQWVGMLIGRLGAVVPAAAGAGAAIETLGFDMKIAAATMSPLMVAGIAGGVAALVGLIFILGRVKDATQQWISSTDKAVQSAGAMNVLGVISNTMASNSARLAVANAQVARSMQDVGTTTGVASRYIQGASGAVARQAQDVQDLTQQQQQLVSTAHTVITNMDFLGRTFHTSALGAAALAQMAGVQLQTALNKGGFAAQVALQQIRNLITGMAGMSAPVGVVGNDMTALAIQSGLAATKVAQLNQAWDQLLGNITGGIGDFSQLVTSIQTMGAGLSASSVNLKGQFGSISTGAATATYSLKGLGANAMQSLQQVSSALSTGGQQVDFFQTALSEGAISGRQFSGSVKDIVGALVPFVAGNQAATAALSVLAQRGGAPANQSLQQMAQWAGIKGPAALKALEASLGLTSAKMSDMGKIAQNLSTVLNSSLVAMVNQATLKASGLQGALNTLSTAIQHGGTVANGFHGSLNPVIQDMLNLHQSVPTITAMLQSMGINLGQAGVKALIAAANLRAVGVAAATAGAQARTAAAQVQQLENMINALHSKTITIQTYMVTTGISVGGGNRIRGGAGGLQHGGVLPGYQPGVDSIPAMLSPGEAILNPYATRALGPDTIHMLNTTAERGGGVNPAALRMGGSGPASAGAPASQPLVVHVFLDGQQIFANQQEHAYSYQTLNSGKRSGLSIPGTQIGG